MSREMKDSGVKWIGNIPSHWNIFRGKVILSKLLRPVLESDEIITCFRDGEVTLRSNRREDGFTMADKEIGYQGIEPGDLVVHGMDGFAGAIGISDSRGKSTPVLNVLDSNQNKEFIMFYLRSMAISNVFLALSTGIRVRSCDLRWNKLGELPYPIPPATEQLAISYFLNKKLSHIDWIISKTKATIKDYKLLKQSIITEVVTKGLDKNREMKDSGIEWIGDVPKHWEVIRIKNISTIKSGNGIKNEELDESCKYEVWGGNGFIGYCDKFNIEGEHIIIGRVGAKCGNVRHSIGRKFITDNALILKIEEEEISGNYIEYVLKAADLNTLNTSNAQPLITGTKVSKVSIPKPSSNDQKDIVRYLDLRTCEIDKLVQNKTQLISELEEYKKALIYEYVTGKIEVR